MIFSRSEEYAIRAMTFLATQPAGKLAGAREISESERIPMQFLWKILQDLTRRRLIRSFKGQRGGYELAQPASRLTLSMILTATRGADRLGRCVLGLPQCSDHDPCPLHDQFKHLRTQFAEMLDNNTLADLAKVAQERARNGKA